MGECASGRNGDGTQNKGQYFECTFGDCCFLNLYVLKCVVSFGFITYLNITLHISLSGNNQI